MTALAEPTSPSREEIRAWMERARRRRRMRQSGLALLMLSPSLVIFAVFVFYPFFRNFQLAFYRTPPFPGLPKQWAGVDQITDVLGSAAFRNSVWVTVKFAVLTVPVGIALGLVLAVLAHQRLRGITVYRTIFSSTVATSVAVASVVFLTLLNPQIGLVNYYLGREGAQSLLQDPTWALPMVALVTIWQNLGFTFILMSAALQAIPDEMLEAAEVDGAGPTRRFLRVTIPLLSPTIFFAFVVGTISAWQAFGQIDLLTQGGPGGSHGATNTLTYFVFTDFFERQNEGTAAVLSIALFFIVLGLTLLQLRYFERRVHYER
ncbi:MAG: sugar ABC transporter permease [Acidimicrobiia bacterium]|nr:sugar ABC transporter permease [Acidimicrobiia bacterium]